VYFVSIATYGGGDVAMTSDQVKAVALLNEYAALVGDAYALYLDAGSAMPRFATFIEEQQQRNLKQFKGQADAPQTIEQLDAANFFYGKGDPNYPGSRVQHVSTQGELKARNQEDGSNCRTVSRVVILTIYQFWEDHYRQQFALAVEKAKNDIASDFFGDIRHIRNDIIHHRNYASERVLKCKTLKYFEPGDEIFLSKEEVMEVMVKFRIALDDLCVEFTGATGGYADRESVAGST
jgi:hypothetical protein